MKHWLILLSTCLVSCASLSPKPNPSPNLSNNKLDNFQFLRQISDNNYQELEQALVNKTLNPLTDRGMFDNSLTHEVVRSVKALELALSHGSPLEAVNSFGDTPLSMAVDSKLYDSVKYLISRGAKVNLQYGFDNSLFHLAAKNKDLKMVDLLIKHQVCPLILGFMDTPLKQVSTSEEIKVKLNDYTEWYIAKFGNKCSPEPVL